MDMTISIMCQSHLLTQPASHCPSTSLPPSLAPGCYPAQEPSWSGPTHAVTPFTWACLFLNWNKKEEKRKERKKTCSNNYGAFNEGKRGRQRRKRGKRKEAAENDGWRTSSLESNFLGLNLQLATYQLCKIWAIYFTILHLYFSHLKREIIYLSY